MRKMIGKILFLGLGLMTATTQVAVAENANLSKTQAPLFDNLGSYHRTISTTNPLAQRFFDQGLVLLYGFEWGEALRSFTEATRLDPHCGMCYWGRSLALISKVNAPETGKEYIEGKAAIQKALELSADETPIEQAYIKALALRFQHEPKGLPNKAEPFSCHTSGSAADTASQKEILAYLSAMKKLVANYPQDNDAKTLYASAVFWSRAKYAHKVETPSVRAAVKALKEVLSTDPLHSGANHYFIHLTEPFAHPEKALLSADRLKTLVPGSEHLVHMPTHIYFLTGHYSDATASSLQAVEVFKQYNKSCLEQGFQPAINFLYFHNYDFLRTTATMEGRKKLALEASRKIVEEPFTSWQALDRTGLQWFIPIPYFTEVRFAQWAEMLKETEPKRDYQYALGMWHYARGLAFANTGQLKAAEVEALQLAKLIKQGASAKNLGKKGHTLLKLANHVLMAELTYLQANKQTAIAHLKTALRLQLNLGYHEPPDWYFPVREALGEAYLKAGQANEAKIIYEQDLKQYPLNGWALYGLAKSLHQLGDEKNAAIVEKQFKKAWLKADIAAPISFFP